MKLFEALMKQTGKRELSEFECSVPGTIWVVERVEQLRKESTDQDALTHECGPFSRELQAAGLEIGPEQIATELLGASHLTPPDWQAVKRYLLATA